MKIFFAIAAIVFGSVILAVGAADALYRTGVFAHDLRLVKAAQRINPTVSEYHLGEYRLTGRIEAITRAIELEPTKPAYHMYFGLALLKQKVRTRASDTEAVEEICTAAALKPYSTQYRGVCTKYRAAIAPSKG